MSTSSILFSILPKEINLEVLELIKAKNVTPHGLREREKKNRKPYKIKETTPINTEYLLSTTKI